MDISQSVGGPFYFIDNNLFCPAPLRHEQHIHMNMHFACSTGPHHLMYADCIDSKVTNVPQYGADIIDKF